MKYCFDIDGTLCTNTDGEYERAEPIVDAIRRVNALANAGHEIVLYTARGSTTGIDWRAVTEHQLETWGVRYEALFFGKPFAHVYVDDRAKPAAKWMMEPLAGGKEDGNPGPGGQPDKLAARTSYLDVTYARTKEEYTDYPSLLAHWLMVHVYGKPGRLLDVGCGRGEHMAAFRRLGFDAVGIDLSPRAPELAPTFDVRVADLEQDALPFPPASVDYVFCKSVVEHMQQPTVLLEKALKALRPGGTAVIMTPSWRHSYWGPFYIDHTHVTPFTAPSLAEAMVIVGYAEVRAQHFYQLPFLWQLPWLKPVVKLIAAMPLQYRPLDDARWPERVNKLIRFSKEVMLLAVGKRPNV